MSHLDTEIRILNEDIQELMHLVRGQLDKGREAIVNFDKDLAVEIRSDERRVDALELKIDRDCENILALFNPVAIDLRFVIACFKINSDMERLGDHAYSIAGYLTDMDSPMDAGHAKELRLEEMYEMAIQMFDHVIEAFDTEDTKLARKVIVMDQTLNEINRNASGVTSRLIKEDPEHLQHYLYLFSTIRKLERVGDLVKNAAEEIVFYLEAKVLKHKKKKYRNNN